MHDLPLDDLAVDERVRQALAQFRARLGERAGGKVGEIVLFGSVARGEARPESDVDVLVVWKGPYAEALDILVDVSTDVLLETGVDIAVHPYPEEDFARMVGMKTGFYENVERDGIRVTG